MIESNVLKEFTNKVVKTFSKIVPAWSPPHAAIYTVAKTMKMEAKVNGMTKAKYDKCWERRFEDGTLETDSGVLTIALVKGKDKAKLKMVSTDCRKITLFKKES